MKTALRLAGYEDILDTQTIYSLIALTAYYNKFFEQCSKAFIKLEGGADVPSDMQEKFQDLALKIFTRNPPRDPSSRMLPCPKCHTRVHDWVVHCTSCNHKLPFCVASGRSIFPEDRSAPVGDVGAIPGIGGDNQVQRCRVCIHQMYVAEVRKFRNCPLCHSRLDAGPSPSTGVGAGGLGGIDGGLGGAGVTGLGGRQY